MQGIVLNREERFWLYRGLMPPFNSQGHIVAVSDSHVFPGFLTPVLKQLFFSKPPTTFLTCFSRGERRKYAGKKVRLNRVSNSQPPGLECDTLIDKPPGQYCKMTTESLKFGIQRIVKRVKWLPISLWIYYGKRRNCTRRAFFLKCSTVTCIHVFNHNTC